MLNYFKRFWYLSTHLMPNPIVIAETVALSNTFCNISYCSLNLRKLGEKILKNQPSFHVIEEVRNLKSVTK